MIPGVHIQVPFLMHYFSQLDFLPEAVSLEQAATSLIPVSLKGKVQPPMASENIGPNTVLPVPVSRRSSSPISSRPVEKNRITSTSPRSSPTLPSIKPERRLSEEEITRHNHHNAMWAFSAPLPGGRALRVVFPKSVVVRTTKSVILAAKVTVPLWRTLWKVSQVPFQMLSIPPACPFDGKLYALTTSSLVLLAISDTWFEHWNVTLGLGALHFALLRFGYPPCSGL